MIRRVLGEVAPESLKELVRRLRGLADSVDRLGGQVDGLAARVEALSPRLAALSAQVEAQEHRQLRHGELLEHALALVALPSGPLHVRTPPPELLAYTRAVHNLAAQAFHPEPGEFLSDPPYVRLRQLDSLPLEGLSIGVLCAAPGGYADALRARGAAKVIEYRLAGLQGPLIKHSEPGREDVPLPIGLDTMGSVLEPADLFWIPDPALAGLLLHSGSFFTALAPTVRGTLSMPLQVATASLFTHAPSAHYAAGDMRAYLVHDDNAVRARLHASGFMEIAHDVAADEERKLTRYDETPGLRAVLLPKRPSAPMPESQLVQLLAHKLPRLPDSRA